jgi:protein-S-isoprenylcysteine O-methyltransferase Ste14
MHLLQYLFFDNSLLTIPGRPQLAMELLQSFLYKIQNHFVYLSLNQFH